MKDLGKPITGWVRTHRRPGIQPGDCDRPDRPERVRGPGRCPGGSAAARSGDRRLHRGNPAGSVAFAGFRRAGDRVLWTGPRRAALADLDRAIAVDPKFAKAYSYRGAAHSRRGQNELALADYDALITLMPENAGAYKDRGGVLVRLARFHQAIQDLDEAIRLDPKRATAYQNRGAAYNSLGQYERAIDDFTEAIRLDPDRAGAYSNRGLAHFAIGEYDQAVVDLSQAIQLAAAHGDHSFQSRRGVRPIGDPRPRPAGLQRSDPARAATRPRLRRHRPDQFQLGRRDAAIHDFDMALRLDPKGVGVYHDRANARRESGDWLGALADYDRAVTIDPKRAETYVARGWARLGAGVEWADNDARAYLALGDGTTPFLPTWPCSPSSVRGGPREADAAGCLTRPLPTSPAGPGRSHPPLFPGRAHRDRLARVRRRNPATDRGPCLPGPRPAPGRRPTYGPSPPPMGTSRRSRIDRDRLGPSHARPHRAEPLMGHGPPGRERSPARCPCHRPWVSSPETSMKQLTLLSLYGHKRKPLAQLIGGCVEIISQSPLRRVFKPYHPLQIHGTLVGMEKLIGYSDDFNANIWVDSGIKTRMDFSLLVDTLKQHLPMTVRFGGFPQFFSEFKSLGLSPYERSFQVQWPTNRFTLIGWPHTRGDFTADRLLEKFREDMGKNCHIQHKFKNDNDLFLVVGEIVGLENLSDIELAQIKGATPSLESDVRNYLAAQESRSRDRSRRSLHCTVRERDIGFTFHDSTPR